MVLASHLVRGIVAPSTEGYSGPIDSRPGPSVAMSGDAHPAFSGRRLRTVGNLTRLILGVAIAVQIAIAVFIVGSLVASHDARAASVSPIFIEGATNRSCAELAELLAQTGRTTPQRSWSELKFEGSDLPNLGASKTLTSADGYLTVTLTRTSADEWSWAASNGVDAVFVKN